MTRGSPSWTGKWGGGRSLTLTFSTCRLPARSEQVGVGPWSRKHHAAPSLPDWKLLQGKDQLVSVLAPAQGLARSGAWEHVQKDVRLSQPHQCPGATPGRAADLGPRALSCSLSLSLPLTFPPPTHSQSHRRAFTSNHAQAPQPEGIRI